VYYEPEIVTEVQSDGTKVSKVVVKVFPDQANRDQFTVLDWDLFTDQVYFDVKDVYEDFEERGLTVNDIDTENDPEVFGWGLSDNWHHIGNFYYFLLSMYNLIETVKDESPIIDTKGNI